jgi:Anti-sigma-K factor rskA
VSHTDPVILALRALGETAGTAKDAEHAQTCPQCRSELARLAGIVELARDEGAAESLQAPPPHVWDRIAAAASAGHPLAVADGNGAPAPAPRGSGNRRGSRARWPRGRLATALAGLAAGLIIGIGGTAGVAQLAKAPAARVVAQVELLPLPASGPFGDATGTAVMRATARQQLMVVTLHAPRAPGFYEVWLLARDGVSMISLGELNASQTGAFVIPPGTDLRNYSRIDISLQPFNGSTAHSKTSVVRGSLPVAALGAVGPR